ncbi:MAG: CRISPR-associated endonuclease Cas3'', partial [Ruminococcus flavefaciens]|nr:CRISPR-associated endonuclease Cas3'' [Ruminococcus flavefaciens]
MTAHISDDGLNREESVAEHTEKTAYLCQEKGKRCGLSQVMSLCAIFHDAGKNKQKFEDYIHADEKTRQKLRGTVAHASTGAKSIYDMYHDSPGSIQYMVEMISYAAAAHHGLFDCVDVEHTDLFSKKLDKVDDYEESCRNARRDYLDDYEPDKIFKNASDEFQTVWNKIKDLFNRLKPRLAANCRTDPREALFDCRLYLFSCLQRLILSILIDSDWEATSDFMDNINTLSKQSKFPVKEIFQEAENNFEAYMRQKQDLTERDLLSEKEKIILDARNSLQGECRRFAKYPAGIYCLPIPTGGGKT